MKVFYMLSLLLFFAVDASSQAKPNPVVTQEGVIATRFFPNPATTQITFEFQKNIDKSSSIQVFNFIGKKMVDQPLSEKVIIALNDFYRGIYIYQLRDRTGKVVGSGKFQVAK